MVCVLGIGDCGSKSESRSTIDIQTLNKSVSNFLSSKAASATASAVNIQDMKIVIGKIAGGCDIDASQTINSTVKALADITAVDTKELQQTVKEAANAQIDQAAKAQTGAFATGQASAKSVSDYKQSVSNIVETNITDATKVDAFASVFNKQTKELNIGTCGDGPDAVNSSKLNASQNIQSDLVAQALLKSTSKALQKLDTDTSTSVGVKQDSSAKVSGLDDIIAAIFSGLTGIYGAIAIICACCCLICCCMIIGVVGVGAASGGGGGGKNMAPAPSPGLAISSLPPSGAS